MKAAIFSLHTAASVFIVLVGARRTMSLSTFVKSSTDVLRAHTAQSVRMRRRMTTGRTLITMMPEGPEVRTLVDQLQGGVGMRLKDLRFLSGRYVKNGKPTGFDVFASTMTFSEDRISVDMLLAWKAKGKFIYILLDNGSGDTSDLDYQRSIWITLGMTGRFVSQEAHDEDTRHARWFLELMNVDTGDIKRIYYHDARNFGTLRFSSSQQELLEKLQSLGPDIFQMSENDFVAIVSVQKPERNVCKFLMDQSKLAGVGNYILAEGLYRSGVDPFAALEEINKLQQRLLFRELQAVALESYEAQGMTRQKGGQYRTMEGDRGQFEFQLQCYGRERSARGELVRRESNGPHGRTIWYTDEQLFMPRQERAMRVLVRDEHSDHDPSKGPPMSSDATIKLMASLTEQTWKEKLSTTFESESFAKLAAFLEIERKMGATIYPPKEDIFSALNLCPFDKIKVVIVGQDPYHGPGQGHGLAFSVRRGVKPPPSLQNVFREAIDDVGIATPMHGNLEHWARQGVLLLNTVLTVRRGEANSHAGQGWERVTDAIIHVVNAKSDGVVFLLWGNPAHKKAASVDSANHFIIRSSHPSPLGATKTKSPFLGSRCFSRANDALKKMGKDPIDWNVK